MNQQVSINEVIKAATQSMETDGISQAYIKQLSHTWNALTEYLSDENACFTREIGILFLKKKYGISDETTFSHLRPIDKRRKRAVLILIYCTEGKSFYRKKDYWPCCFHDPFEPVFTSFLSERKSHDYALSTINRDIYTLNHFSKFLDISETNGFADITARTFQDFMKWMSASKNLPTLKNATATLRQLAKYLFREGILEADYSSAILQVRCRKTIPSVYDQSEIKTMLNSLNKASAVGIRNHAMVLMAAQLGIYVTEVAYLKKFDELCCTMDVQTPLLTKELMDAWCTKKPYEADRSYFQQRVSCIRQLSLYLNTLGYDAYIPVNLEYIRQRKSKYSAYIFTHEEIAKIFSASNQIYPNRHSTMHLVMPVLIRLLYCTGVRIMEALKLQLKHVDLVNGTLMIEAAKFNKDRLIPVSASMLEILKQYCSVMHPKYNTEEYLFIGITREPCSHHNVYLRFRELLVSAGIQHAGRGYGPRIHDIRHTHCCHVLQKASGTGMDLTNMLPALSVYMGHESITATSQYLKMTAEVYPEILDAVEALCAQVIPEVGL